jgi:hypothetical protein
MTPPTDRVIVALRYRSIVRGMAEADGVTPEPEMDAVEAKEGAGPMERYWEIWGGVLLLALEGPLKLPTLSMVESDNMAEDLDAGVSETDAGVDDPVRGCCEGSDGAADDGAG